VAFVVVRRTFRLHYLTALIAAFGVLSPLLQEENSIWGGNLLSVLAGEFAYSYGQLFALLAMAAWINGAVTPRAGSVAGVFVALAGASHGYPLLIVGFSTLTLFVIDPDAKRTWWMLVKGHSLAFCLLGGWLWPMLEMHDLTVANDSAIWMTTWHEALPKALW